MASLCGLLGMRKQAFYQHKKRDSRHRRLMLEEFVVQFVLETRQTDPGIGGDKLHEIYKRRYGSTPGLSVGRDRMERIISENGLTVRKKRRKPRTTDSRHGLPLYPNLIKDVIPIRPNQIWVADITYIPIWPGRNSDEYRFCYLSMLTDSYTKEIVGWCVGETLETRYCIETLKMAVERLAGLETIDLTHHSDRGVQYASEAYVELLNELGVKISMTESGDPRDNPVAERLNGTVKNEFMKDIVFHSAAQVRSVMPRIVEFYNTQRPHMSLDGMMPSEAAKMTGRIRKRWVSYRERYLDNLEIKEGASALAPQTLNLIDQDFSSPVNKFQG